MEAVERISVRLEPSGDPAPAVLAALETVERFADAAPLPSSTAARLAVLVEELVSNVLRHGAMGHAISLEVELAAAKEAVTLRLSDNGVAFDPTAYRAFTGPDLETGGSVGLALIRAWASEPAYRREGGINCLTLRLPLQ
jgi:anti-sigma regulatory factor (Ser/Thr protein kinase)